MRYLWQCEECEEQLEVVRKLADMEVIPTEEEISCECKAEYKRLLTVTAFSCPPGATDGGRFHSKLWGQYKEKAALEAERVKIGPDKEKRKYVDKAIKKLGETVK